VDTQIALAFLRRYPTPGDTKGLGEQRLQAFLKRHGYPGRKPAGELLKKLRDGAEGRASELETQARRQIVLALVSSLEPIVKRISELGVRPSTTPSDLHTSQTPAAATTAGRPTSTTAPAPEAPATPTPPASSDAPGAKSSGASGTTTTPTTPYNTPPCNASSQPEVDTRGLKPGA
jgi:hypothetical protein